MALALLLPACSDPPVLDRGDAIRVQIRGSTTEAVFFLELADDDAEREQGLMNRTRLQPNGGMLFVWPDAAPRSFWMKSTVIPLDLIAIRDRQVVSLHSLQPCLQEECPRTKTARADAAVEVPLGTVAHFDIRVGARVSALPDVLARG